MGGEKFPNGSLVVAESAELPGRSQARPQDPRRKSVGLGFHEADEGLEERHVLVLPERVHRCLGHLLAVGVGAEGVEDRVAGRRILILRQAVNGDRLDRRILLRADDRHELFHDPRPIGGGDSLDDTATDAGVGLAERLPQFGEGFVRPYRLEGMGGLLADAAEAILAKRFPALLNRNSK